jgi:hypothetical protein
VKLHTDESYYVTCLSTTLVLAVAVVVLESQIARDI